VTDFLDEVARELRGDRERIAALEELERLTIELAAQLRRPVTVFDVVRAAPDAGERERRLALLRALRAGQDPSAPAG
jgi:hypothetical protein